MVLEVRCLCKCLTWYVKAILVDLECCLTLKKSRGFKPWTVLFMAEHLITNTYYLCCFCFCFCFS